MTNIDPAIMEALQWAMNGPETSYDGRPLRAIVDDYAVVRGDLTEEYARRQLARIALRSADVQALCAEGWDEGYATCLGDFDIAARRESRSPNPHRAATEDQP